MISDGSLNKEVQEWGDEGDDMRVDNGLDVTDIAETDLQTKLAIEKERMQQLLNIFNLQSLGKWLAYRKVSEYHCQEVKYNIAQALLQFPSFDLRATDDSSIGLEWVKWVERFENFILACDIEEDVRKKVLLLHYMGKEVYDIFRSLPEANTRNASIASTTIEAASMESQETTSEYEAAKAKPDPYFTPQVNPTFAIYRFRQEKQNEGESLDTFYTCLRQLSRHCNLTNVDFEIKNQLILTTTLSRLRKYAMLHSLDLADILKQGRSFEDIERDVMEIERNPDNSAPVHRLGKRDQHQAKKPNQKTKAGSQQDTTTGPKSSSNECHNCGGRWPHDGGKTGCPAWGKTCNSCHKSGHFAFR
ncbi:uncharacterized protein LOC135386412 [Ornithodoros turicata]|uniref:uncharacterized protein LOC135386412 n=1 Tax=Ornithodoros turicata TaxID=34597 RepID=UPI0031392E14